MSEFYVDGVDINAETSANNAIVLQRIREYCERVLNNPYLLGVSSDHEAGHLAGQEAACHHVLEILNGEDE